MSVSVAHPTPYSLDITESLPLGQAVGVGVHKAVDLPRLVLRLRKFVAVPALPYDFLAFKGTTFSHLA